MDDGSGRTSYRPRLIRFFLIAGLVCLLDQAVKQLVIARIPLYGNLEVIPGFFSLVHLYNPGGAFGFLARSGHGWLNIFFVVFGCLTLGVIVYFLKHTPDNYKFLQLSLALIFGGAVGNLADRIRIGKVVDFLDFYLGQYHWPAFNLADSAISVGVAVFVFHLLLRKIPY